MFFITCSTTSDPNEPNPIIYLSPANSDLSLTGQSNLSLIIENISNSIFGMSLQIDYNNSILNFVDSTGFSKENYFSQSAISFAKNNGSKIYLSFSQLQGSSVVSGSGTICSLTFGANLAGNALIDIDPNEIVFYNANGEEFVIPNLEVAQASINVQ